MITQAESIVHLCGAAALATALLGVGLAGRRMVVDGRPRRRVRRAWVAMGVGAALATLYVADAERSGVHRGPGAVAVTSAVALAGLAVAALLLRLGLRGRRVGDHEYCRRCGFDLSGRPVGTAVCNECGASLDAPRATVVGVRRRRPVPLVLGGFALLLSLAIASSAVRPAIALVRETNWQQYRPESSLIADLRSGVPGRERSAAEALTFKEDRHALSPDGQGALLDFDLSLAARGRPRGFSSVAWPISRSIHAWRDGRVDEAIVRRALQLSLDLSMAVADAGEQGGPLRFDVYSPKHDAAGDVVIHCERRADVLAGISLGPPFASPYRVDDGSGWGGGLPMFGNTLPVPATHPLGPATLTTTMTVTATLSLPGRPTLVERRDVTLTAATSIVPPGGLRCPPILDARGDLALPADPPIVRLRPPGPATGWSLVVTGAGGGDWLGDLLCRTRDGTERLLATRWLSGGNGTLEVPVDGRLPSPCEIVFRPRPELGAHRLVGPSPTFQREFAVPLDVRPGQ